MKNNKKLRGFTLVELIVVITILSILGTIGFISFQGYGVSARDSVRLIDIRSIDKGMSFVLTKGEKLPIPFSKIDITASGTVISYQGYADESVLGKISVHGGGTDPLDGSYYTYVTDTTLTKYQIMGYFENNDLVNIVQTTYAGLETRYPKMKGFKLGILIDPITNEPAQKSGTNIDIINTTVSYKVVIDNTDTEVSGTGSILEKKLNFRVHENGSCNALLKNGVESENGIYTINPTGSEEFDVYCDMKTDGGGWTRIDYASDLTHEAHFSNGDRNRYLDNNFSFILTDDKINAIRNVSIEGKQWYHGTCQGVIHYRYKTDNYGYAFGFKFHEGGATVYGKKEYPSSNITVSNDGCIVNNNNLTSTDFDIRDIRLPVLNVHSRDNASNEKFGSPLTENPTWFR